MDLTKVALISFAFLMFTIVTSSASLSSNWYLRNKFSDSPVNCCKRYEKIYRNTMGWIATKCVKETPDCRTFRKTFDIPIMVNGKKIIKPITIAVGCYKVQC